MPFLRAGALGPRLRLWSAPLDRERLVAGWRPSASPGETLTGEGIAELGAVTDLAMMLEERARADAAADVDQRGRLAFLAGAEEESRRLGRRLSDEELERVLRRFRQG